MCVCAFSLPVRKTNSAVFDNRPVCASLSVDKATEQKWEEIGLFVRKCLSATDWIEKPNGQKHSRNAGVFMEECEFDVAV